MSFRLILVLEPVVTVCAVELLFALVSPGVMSVKCAVMGQECAYCSSSNVLNFLGFFGQQSHTWM